MLNPRVSDTVTSAQSRQISAHDKRVQSRSFSFGDIVYVCNYGQGPKWIRGTIIDIAGPHNFQVEVVLSGQSTTWKRHADQIRKCYNSSNIIDTTVTVDSEEEKVKEHSPEITVFGNFSLPPQQPSAPVVVPCRNPPRNRRPPDRLTY